MAKVSVIIPSAVFHWGYYCTCVVSGPFEGRPHLPSHVAVSEVKAALDGPVADTNAAENCTKYIPTSSLPFHPLVKPDYWYQLIFSSCTPSTRAAKALLTITPGFSVCFYNDFLVDKMGADLTSGGNSKKGGIR